MRGGGRRWRWIGALLAGATACGGVHPTATTVGDWAKRAIHRGAPANDPATGVVTTGIETVDLTAALVVHCPPDRRPVTSLDEAYLRFEECAADETTYRRRRTQVQERLVAASNAQCGEYKRHLRDVPAPAGPTATGSLARAAMAGLGMAAPPVAVVKGLSDAVTAVRASSTPVAPSGGEDLGRRVVLLGIDTHRAALLQAIRVRQREGMDGYPIQTAVVDALTYHDACSEVGGLDAAVGALVQSDPGIVETRASFAHEAAETAAAAIARTRENLTAQRTRLMQTLLTAEADAPDERTTAQTALVAAESLAADRAAEVDMARSRIESVTDRLTSTTDPRFRASLLADVDVEVSRAVRASTEVEDAYVTARSAVDALAARVAPLGTTPPSPGM